MERDSKKGTSGRGPGGRFAPGNPGKRPGTVNAEKHALALLARQLHEGAAQDHYKDLFQPQVYKTKVCPVCQGTRQVPLETKALTDGSYVVVDEVPVCPACRGTGNVLKNPSVELMKVREMALENLRNRGWGKPLAVVKIDGQDDDSPEAMLVAIMEARNEEALDEEEDGREPSN